MAGRKRSVALCRPSTGRSPISSPRHPTPVLAVAAAAAAGCGSSAPPPTKPAPPLTGTWTRTIQDFGPRYARSGHTPPPPRARRRAFEHPDAIRVIGPDRGWVLLHVRVAGRRLEVLGYGPATQSRFCEQRGRERASYAWRVRGGRLELRRLTGSPCLDQTVLVDGRGGRG